MTFPHVDAPADDWLDSGGIVDGCPTADDMKARTTDRLNALRALLLNGGVPRCQYAQTANQVLSSGSYTRLTAFAADITDTLGGTLATSGTSSGVYTVPSAMRLEISAQLTVSNGSVRVVLAVYKNDAEVWAVHGPDNTGGTDRSVTLPAREMAVAANDTISFYAFVNGTGVATVTADTWFRLKQVG